MKQFDIPTYYKSSIIGKVKALRKAADPRKKDYSPTKLDFGPIEFLIARHFGFCYGVENAIEIAYKAITNHPNRPIYLLSEMIHNPEVNADLNVKGVQFIMDTHGRQLIAWENIPKDAIVVIPAFGTTLEIKSKLVSLGIEIDTYDTTCPFVEKVWKRADALGKQEYTIVVHGKHDHEETRATFSHSKQNAPTVVVRDLPDTKKLADIILGLLPPSAFYEIFDGKYSMGFDAEKDLQRIAVVNQTTMLASETQEIANHLKETMVKKYGHKGYKYHFADTRDTLCYATNDNQRATFGLLEGQADLAIVVGGYNSSNTSHIVELCEEKFSTYFISSAEKILSQEEILHFDIHSQQEILTKSFLPLKEKVTIVLTSGASCPDAAIDRVLHSLLSFYPNAKPVEVALAQLKC